MHLADKLNIIDKPNARSSHTKPTIRGGGIVFPVAWVVYFSLNGFPFPFFTCGLILLAVISFADDIKPVSNKLRLAFHLLAFSLCFYELGLFSILPIWFLMIVYIISIGCLNAINFMDGINGMTGLYMLAIFVPMLMMRTGNPFENPIAYIIMSILVFGFFNFRTKARFFAGDVGSVSMAYIVIFFILGFMFHRWQVVERNLIIKPSGYTDFSLRYLLLLCLYGVDTILTLVHRIYLKENIFQAHRKHLYQYFANELKWPHMIVAGIYATIQFGISIYILSVPISFLQGFSLVLGFSILYGLIKFFIIKIKMRHEF